MTRLTRFDGQLLEPMGLTIQISRTNIGENCKMSAVKNDLSKRGLKALFKMKTIYKITQFGMQH